MTDGEIEKVLDFQLDLAYIKALLAAENELTVERFFEILDKVEAS